MMFIYRKYTTVIVCCFLLVFLFISCKKLIAIPDPLDTITTEKVFDTEQQAEGAMVGVYNFMIHGENPSSNTQAGLTTFSAGLATLAGGLSSGELYNSAGTSSPDYYWLSINKLTFDNSIAPVNIWTSAYASIYRANSIIEGIEASTSPELGDSARKVLSGEAKLVRAFCYFYLTNFFGDVPLALTVDFNQTGQLPRAPQAEVYQQILRDLLDAENGMSPDYSAGRGKRVRPNKWAATAMLARTYLYLGDYANAALKASDVIDQQDLYRLEPVSQVFRTTSQEAIWQLMQSENPASGLKNATPEGWILLPLKPYQDITPYPLTNELLSVFEPGDERRGGWIDSTLSISAGVSQGLAYYPSKYKVGFGNSVIGVPAQEYYVVLRLAEQYLIRAEARANGAPGGADGAVDDLNMIRKRAGLDPLSKSLNLDQVKAAIAKERQTELFAEWGHRWFDLKRTGAAHNVLSNIPLKQPWEGDQQLLYPIPQEEIVRNSRLKQNNGY